MTQAKIIASRHAGFTLIEVMVALLIITLGLLGLAGMQVRMQQAEFESYQRAQALVLLYDMVDRINFNRATASCFITTAASTPYLGTGSTVTPACGASTAANNTMANNSITEWNNALLGAAETKGGGTCTSADSTGCIGAMVGARGCVSLNAGVYTVAVAWQGTIETFAPTVNCGNDLYGPDARRRVVSTTFRMATLN